MLGTAVCQVGGKAGEAVAGLGARRELVCEGRSRQKAVVSKAGERVPSNPWGTGLRTEYYAFVRRRLHFFLQRKAFYFIIINEWKCGC